MASPFSPAEFEQRLARTRTRMAERGMDHLVVTDPANLYYLTGFDACSFYNPQALVVPADGPLAFFCREVDATSAWQTSNLDESQVFGYPERFVQKPDVHPMDWIAATLQDLLAGSAIVGVENESPQYTIRAHDALVAGLGRGIAVRSTPSIVNWVRAVKTPAEIEVMRAAGRITERIFEAATEAIRPGVRQSDAVAEIYAAQIRGLDDAGGAYAAIPPLVLAGVNTSYPHVPWSDTPFGETEPIALELSGCRYRYHAPVARTMFLGDPPTRLLDLAAVVGEGLDEALATMRAGAPCEDPAIAWDAVIARHGLTKESRIGYPVGIGYPPDWGEQTMSLRKGERMPLEAGMTFHVMIGMWLDGWGYSVSETVLITDTGVDRLASIPGGLLRPT